MKSKIWYPVATTYLISYFCINTTKKRQYKSPKSGKKIIYTTTFIITEALFKKEKIKESTNKCD